MPSTNLGTFKELIQDSDQPLQRIANQLRKIILKIDPDVCEVVRLGERSATYGLGPKKMSEGYVYIMPQGKWVNLGFFKGAELDDPEGLLEGTGAKMRHVKIRSLKGADAPAVGTLISAALVERTDAMGL